MRHSLASTDGRMCPTCRLRLWLVGVRTVPTGSEVQKFECSNCSYSIDIIEPPAEGRSGTAELKSRSLDLRLREVIR